LASDRSGVVLDAVAVIVKVSPVVPAGNITGILMTLIASGAMAPWGQTYGAPVTSHCQSSAGKFSSCTQVPVGGSILTWTSDTGAVPTLVTHTTA
jgi:hypothetical protein